MSRLTTSILPICIGAGMSAPVLFGNSSMSNIVNAIQALVGLILVGFGVLCWFKADAPANASLEDHSGLPRAPAQSKKTTFERVYLLYFKYLLLLPGAVALTCWTVSFKLIGCGMSGASMEIYGCGLLGTMTVYLYLYAVMLLAAMLTFFIPVTVVYLVQVLRKRSSPSR